MIIDGEGGEAQENDFAAFEMRVNSGEETPPAGEATPPAGEAGEGEGGEATPPAGEAGEGEGGEATPPAGEAGEGEEGDDKPGKRTAVEQIKHYNRLWREEQAARETDRKGYEARFAALEAKINGEKPLTNANESGNEGNEAVAPDPSDLEKYPLGALDDRYIQDAIAFQADKAAKAMVDSLLQRQEQSAAQTEAEQLMTELRSKADNVAAKGVQIHADYQETVVDAGMRGDYDLTQVTFEAAAEAEHGAQILYGLATDKAEASRVAKLSPFQQLKYVSDKNAEIAKGSSANRIPGAPPPPPDTSRGKGTRTVSSATTNFAEFEALANGKK